VLRIRQEGNAWTVAREGQLIQHRGRVCVYRTYDEALSVATVVAHQAGDQLIVSVPEPSHPVTAYRPATLLGRPREPPERA
jgi:hypothetical protein